MQSRNLLSKRHTRICLTKLSCSMRKSFEISTNDTGLRFCARRREVPERLELLEEAKSAAVAGRYQEAKDFYCFVDATAHFGSTN